MNECLHCGGRGGVHWWAGSGRCPGKLFLVKKDMNKTEEILATMLGESDGALRILVNATRSKILLDVAVANAQKVLQAHEAWLERLVMEASA